MLLRTTPKLLEPLKAVLMTLPAGRQQEEEKEEGPTLTDLSGLLIATWFSSVVAPCVRSQVIEYLNSAYRASTTLPRTRPVI
jgi:hypothetical protein